MAKNTAPKKTSEENAQTIPAVEKDHNVNVVYGTIKDFKFRDSDGTVTVTDTAGKEHTAEIPNRTTARHMLIQWFGAKNDVLTQKLADGRAQRGIPKATQDKPRLFRIVREPGRNWLDGVVSPRYRTITSEELAGTVKEKFPKATVKVTPSNGLHAGHINVDLGKVGDAKFGALNYTMDIDMGAKNGRRAARVFASGAILFCKNQLTVEVAPLIKDLPIGVIGQSVNRHTKSPIQRILDAMDGLAEGGDTLYSFTKDAQNVKLTEDQMENILSFYVYKKQISSKTKQVIMDGSWDKKDQQVPNTLYGLAMAVTHCGTHNDEVSKNIKRRLSILGTELLLLSKNYKSFLKMAFEVVDEHERRIAEAEAEAQARVEVKAKKTGQKTTKEEMVAVTV